MDIMKTIQRSKAFLANLFFYLHEQSTFQRTIIKRNHIFEFQVFVLAYFNHDFIFPYDTLAMWNRTFFNICSFKIMKLPDSTSCLQLFYAISYLNKKALTKSKYWNFWSGTHYVDCKSPKTWVVFLNIKHSQNSYGVSIFFFLLFSLRSFTHSLSHFFSVSCTSIEKFQYRVCWPNLFTEKYGNHW